MIVSFRHKGLKKLFRDRQTALIDVRVQRRLLQKLDTLDAASALEDLDLPGFGFHGLRGRPKRYALHVTGGWRLTFGWDGEDAVHLDFENYH